MNIKSAIVRRLSQLVIDSDLDLAGYNLFFSDLRLQQGVSGYLTLHNKAGTAWQSLIIDHLLIQGSIAYQASETALSSADYDNAFAMLRARRNSVGLKEVARIAGGAEEAFEFLKGKLTGELKGNGQVISNALIADELTSAPAADATQVGRIIRVRSGAGVATSVKMCCLNSANAYEWVVLGTAS